MRNILPFVFAIALVGGGCSDDFSAEGGTVTDSSGAFGSLNGISVGNNLFPQVSPTLSSQILPVVSDEEVVSDATTTRNVIHLLPFIDPNAYAKEWAKKADTEVVSDIVAGVVNHHALAGDLLVRFMRTLRESRPEATRFIILSPDHFMAGRTPMSTTERSFQLNDTTIAVDREAIAALAPMVQIDEGTLFQKEHGVGAVVAYLAEAFPQASIIPLTLQSTMKDPQAAELGRALAPLLDRQTVVIVSADMSHYLPEKTALENDRLTLSALESLDARTLGSLNDDYTDNRPSFVALRAALDTKSIQPTWTLLDHSISSRYGGTDAFTTSYINGFWSGR